MMIVEPLPVQTKPKVLPKEAGVYSRENLFCALNVKRWFSCREDFHAQVRHDCQGFYYGAKDPLSLVGLIDWTERALNIHPDHRVKFFVCQKDVQAPPKTQPFGKEKYEGVVMLEMSDFWRAEKIRFCFLTALCRAHYNVVWFHPLDAILSVRYFNTTRRAVGMFIGGHTIYTGKVRPVNWVNVFQQVQATKNLVRPSSEADCAYFYNHDPRPQLTPGEKWQITQWVKSKENREDMLEPFGF